MVLRCQTINILKLIYMLSVTNMQAIPCIDFVKSQLCANYVPYSVLARRIARTINLEQFRKTEQAFFGQARNNGTANTGRKEKRPPKLYCFTCSPPAVEYALVVVCQFKQPTFPCWLKASWKRVH